MLHLQNADNLLKKVRSDDSRLKPLLKEKDDSGVIEEIFLSTLGRRATKSEAVAVTKSLAGADREEVFADLFWALLNTKEFAFNH